MGGNDGGAPSCAASIRPRAAAFLGITEDELKAELDGSAFLEVAEANGKTIDDVRAFLIQQATDQIDERLQAASDAPAGSDSAEPGRGGHNHLRGHRGSGGTSPYADGNRITRSSNLLPSRHRGGSNATPMSV